MASRKGATVAVETDLRDNVNLNGADDDNDTDSDEDDDPEEKEKGKRERINLEALDPSTKVQTGISMPAGLKLKVQEDAEKADVSISTFILRRIAEWYDYTLPKTVRTRKPVYATEEERVAARKASMQKRQDLIKALMARFKENPEAFGDVTALLNSNGTDDDDDE